MPYDACYITQEVCWRLCLHLAVQTDQSRSVYLHVCFSSEWQLRAACAVVGSPPEAVVPCADS